MRDLVVVVLDFSSKSYDLTEADVLQCWNDGYFKMWSLK